MFQTITHTISQCTVRDRVLTPQWARPAILDARSARHSLVALATVANRSIVSQACNHSCPIGASRRPADAVLATPAAAPSVPLIECGWTAVEPNEPAASVGQSEEELSPTRVPLCAPDPDGARRKSTGWRLVVRGPPASVLQLWTVDTPRVHFFNRALDVATAREWTHHVLQSSTEWKTRAGVGWGGVRVRRRGDRAHGPSHCLSLASGHDTK